MPELERWRCAKCRTTLSLLTMSPELLPAGYRQELKCYSCNTLNLIEVTPSDAVRVSHELPQGQGITWPRLVSSDG